MKFKNYSSQLHGELSLEKKYLENLVELTQLRDKFFAWKSNMEGLIDPQLEDCLALLSDCGFDFPRIVQPHISFPLTIYRVRVIPNGSPEDISSLQTFSYPPTKFATSFQRANAPGHPVFYGAVDAMTAMEELRTNGEPIKAGDQIFLSTWRVRPQTTFSISYFTRRDIVEERHTFSVLTTKVFSEMHRIFAGQGEFFLKRQLFLYDGFVDLFFSSPYHITGSLAHQVLFGTPETAGIRLDAIAYPSCANDFRSINFAFRPDFVDQGMELLSVRQVTFSEFVGNGALTLGNYNGLIEKGRIKWVQYVTYLRIEGLSANVYLVQECISSNLMDCVMSFSSGEQLRLGEYCLKQADQIDLSDMQLNADSERYYLKGEKMTCVLVNDFEEGIACLRVDGREIGIAKLEIIVPADPTIREVEPSVVLASL